MILIYYRRKDGSIRTFHKYNDGKSLDEINDIVVTYNQVHAGMEVAHAVEYADDSFEAHLFKAAMQRKAWDKESVQDLISSLRSALDAAYALEGDV